MIQPAPPVTREVPALDEGALAAGPLRVHGDCASDPGRVRATNEDAVAVIAGTPAQPSVGALAVVCDGVGGHGGGDTASRLAVGACLVALQRRSGDLAGALEAALRQANRAIRALAATKPELCAMATTCTTLAIADGVAACAHVGDSRAYLLRDGALLQLTEDHSEVQRLVRAGALAREDADAHPRRNVILQALGLQDEPAIAVWPRAMPVRPGDRFLACTDGLHGLVDEGVLREIMVGDDPSTACAALVQYARAAGGHDNISVAVLHVTD
jgi:protein phosphatase